MYISRIRLDTSKRKTQLALEAPGKLHGAVERAFDERQRRNLWRIDKLKDAVYLLIVSEEKPELSVIAQQFGYEQDMGEYRDYDTLLSRLKAQTVWRFRLVANPVFHKKGEASRGKVTAHVSEKYQMEWLEKAAARNGFLLCPDTARIVSSDWKIFYRKENGGRVRFREVAYEGILKIEDEALFRYAMVEGIGREKAYGMGMITVISV